MRNYPKDGTNKERHAWGEWFEREQRAAIDARITVETDESISDDEVHLYQEGELVAKLTNLGKHDDPSALGHE